MRVQLRLEQKSGMAGGALRGSFTIVARAAVAVEQWDAAFVHLLMPQALKGIVRCDQ
jgi:hypothetical protein